MVSLLPVREVSDFDPKAKPDPAKPIGPGMNVVETSLDGSFSAPNVKPGTYYVIAEKQGYLSPMEQFTTDDLNHPTPEVKKQIDKTLQKVTVEPHAATSVEVRLENGLRRSAEPSASMMEDQPPVCRSRHCASARTANGRRSPPLF